MKLPPGWAREGPDWYTNAALRVGVSYETAAASPMGNGDGWYCYPHGVGGGDAYGPEPTLRRAMALAESNSKGRTR